MLDEFHAPTDKQADREQKIDQRLKSTGARKFVRDVFGRTKKDQAEKDNFKRTKASGQSRKAEAVGALKGEHAKELPKQPAYLKPAAGVITVSM